VMASRPVDPSRPTVPLVSTADERAIDGLVARAAAGDSSAFAALYDEFAPRLYRYVAFRVREPSDAEDLVQRVFLKVIEALPRYEQRGVPFSAWLFRLARNATIDFVRTAREHLPLDTVTNRPVETPDPADLAARASDLASLDAAIRTLTPDQQQVIACRFLAGLTTAETAAVLGRREVAVRALQFRALGALRRRLSGTSGIEEFGLGETAP
jgi:RNA polymerase sigma-70 factor, ECF subfamily